MNLDGAPHAAAERPEPIPVPLEQDSTRLQGQIEGLRAVLTEGLGLANEMMERTVGTRATAVIALPGGCKLADQGEVHGK